MSDIRRDLLVRCAFAAIAVHGFEGLRLRDIAGAAGIDHSTVHHYFRTKEQLVSATVEYATSLFGVSLAPDGPACVRLRDHFDEIAELMRSRPELFVVMNEIAQHALRDETTQAAVDAQYRGWSSALVHLLVDGQSEGCWTDRIDPQDAARLIMATMQGANRIPASAASVLGQLENLFHDRSAVALTEHIHHL